MDRIMQLGWEIKSTNGAFVRTYVFLHICAQRSEGEEFIINDVLVLPRGQPSWCFFGAPKNTFKYKSLPLTQCLSNALDS